MVACACLSGRAYAIPINVTLSGGALAIAAPKADLGNFGDGSVLSWLTTDVVGYNSLRGTSLPAPTAVNDATGLDDGAGGNSITLDLTGSHDYLFLHWGGQNGGWGQAFYIAGLTGEFTFSNSTIDNGAGNPAVGALSGFSFYNGDPAVPPQSIPDGGTTALLLGAGLLGLGIVRRTLNSRAVIRQSPE